MPGSNPAYVMPPVTVGPCIWFEAPGIGACAGLITEVNQRSCGILVFPPGSHGGVLKEAVRHASDPEYPKLTYPSGVWDYTDSQKATQFLVECINTPIKGEERKRT